MLPKITQLLSSQTIAEINQKLAKKITANYHHKKPILIGLCNGVIPFLADLIRLLDFDLQIDCIMTSSYNGKIKSSSKIKLSYQPKINLKKQHIIIIDEIIDTGKTIKAITDELQQYQPKSIEICTLLNKPNARENFIKIDYIGTEVSDFVVGYGLDYDNFYRNLPYIGKLEQ